ncbi:unnamed protein product [marine sediment metagenome]|uniref:DNA methylase N-4/N-6 domain-containing protein n=1 Tax=marine sediment metagenome TaxID=412755 RepID=X1R2C9_9ZZZZ
MITERFDAAFVDIGNEAMRRIFTMLPNVYSVLDPTYGHGFFYKLTPWLKILGGDIDEKRAKDVILDMRYLPFKNNSFDCCVLDPPFLHSSRKKGTKAPSFRKLGQRKRQSCSQLLELYKQAGKEAFRVARQIVIMKCADMVDTTELIPIAARLIQMFGDPWEILITTHTQGALPAQGRILHFRHNYVYYLVWKIKS